MMHMMIVVQQDARNPASFQHHHWLCHTESPHIFRRCVRPTFITNVLTNLNISSIYIHLHLLILEQAALADQLVGTMRPERFDMEIFQPIVLELRLQRRAQICFDGQ